MKMWQRKSNLPDFFFFFEKKESLNFTIYMVHLQPNSRPFIPTCFVIRGCPCSGWTGIEIVCFPFLFSLCYTEFFNFHGSLAAFVKWQVSEGLWKQACFFLEEKRKGRLCAETDWSPEMKSKIKKLLITDIL